jgi:hypothetical protein
VPNKERKCGEKFLEEMQIWQLKTSKGDMLEGYLIKSGGVKYSDMKEFQGTRK